MYASGMPLEALRELLDLPACSPLPSRVPPGAPPGPGGRGGAARGKARELQLAPRVRSVMAKAFAPEGLPPEPETRNLTFEILYEKRIKYNPLWQ